MYLRGAQPSPPGAPSSRLAERLLDACTDLQHRLDAPVAVVLMSDAQSFYVGPPASTAECDMAAAVWGEAIQTVADLTVPSVACLGGDAIGPAWELALACDLRIAAGNAQIGSPEITWGRMPSSGGTQRLARLIGAARATEMLLLGEVVDAATALQRGLLHCVTASGDPDLGLETLLEPLRDAAPLALSYVKEAVHHGMELSLVDGLRLEADLAVLLQSTRDRAEGISAFLERRKPRFEGQ